MPSTEDPNSPQDRGPFADYLEQEYRAFGPRQRALAQRTALLTSASPTPVVPQTSPDGKDTLYSVKKLKAMKPADLRKVDFTDCQIEILDEIFPKQMRYGYRDPPPSYRKNARMMRRWRLFGRRQQEELVLRESSTNIVTPKTTGRKRRFLGGSDDGESPPKRQSSMTNDEAGGESQLDGSLSATAAPYHNVATEPIAVATAPPPNKCQGISLNVVLSACKCDQSTTEAITKGFKICVGEAIINYGSDTFDQVDPPTSFNPVRDNGFLVNKNSKEREATHIFSVRERLSDQIPQTTSNEEVFRSMMCTENVTDPGRNLCPTCVAGVKRFRQRCRLRGTKSQDPHAYKQRNSGTLLSPSELRKKIVWLTQQKDQTAKRERRLKKTLAAERQAQVREEPAPEILEEPAPKEPDIIDDYYAMTRGEFRGQFSVDGASDVGGSS